MLGMTLALRLAQQGQRVTLYESAPELGGLASAWQLDDVVWDRHYHVTLLSDLVFRNLLQELGLEDQMQWVETRTGCYSQGQLYSVSNALEFLKFPPLRLIDKVRLGMTIIYASRIHNWQRLEQVPVADWLRSWSGDRTFDKFWLPLLRAKLGDNYKIASAAFIWSTIARLYAARRTGLKKEMFGYLPGGYSRILKRFGEVLSAAGVEIKLEHRAQEISSASGRQRIVFENGVDKGGTSASFDQVVVTTASPIAAKICPELNSFERDRLNGIEYQGILCASLLLKQPLSNFYVTNITDPGVPFTGVIEMTALVDRKEFNGRSLVYLPKYLPSDDPTLGIDEGELREQFISALERLYPEFNRSDVLSFQLSRVKYVVAISTLQYSQQLPPMHTSIPGLHIINSAHILNGTLNVNETVQLAETAAQDLIHDFIPPNAPREHNVFSPALRQCP
jgi:protoporphyrinogen oxidase